MADAIQTLIAELRDYKQSENAQRIRATVETMVAAFQQTDAVVGPYATGTWTPADVSGAGLVLTDVYAEYTTIGNLFFGTVRINYPANASALAVAISLPPGINIIRSSPGAAMDNAAIGLVTFTNGSAFGLFVQSSVVAVTNAQLASSGFYGSLIGWLS